MILLSYVVMLEKMQTIPLNLTTEELYWDVKLGRKYYGKTTKHHVAHLVREGLKYNKFHGIFNNAAKARCAAKYTLFFFIRTSKNQLNLKCS